MLALDKIIEKEQVGDGLSDDELELLISKLQEAEQALLPLGELYRVIANHISQRLYNAQSSMRSRVNSKRRYVRNDSDKLDAIDRRDTLEPCLSLEEAR